MHHDGNGIMSYEWGLNNYVPDVYVNHVPFCIDQNSEEYMYS